MLSTRSLSLRRKLPLLVSLLTAGALLLAGALAYVEVRGAARAAAEARLRSLGQQLVGLIGANLEPRQAQEERLARAPVLIAALSGGPADSAALAEALDAFRTSSDRDLPVLLFGADGLQRFAIGQPPPGNDPLPQPQLDSVRVLGGFREVGGQVVYWQSVPVLGMDGKGLGWVAQRRLIGNSQTGSVLETLAGSDIRISLGHQTDSVWIDLGGVIERDRPSELITGESFTYALEDGGEEVLAFAEPLGATPWVLLLRMPMAEVLTGPRAFLRRSLMLGAALTLLVVLIAWRASRRLTDPLEAMAAAADRVAAGDYRSRVPADGNDELARLAHAFNSMSEQVARSDEALRQRLEEARALAGRLEEANVSAERSREEAHAANRAKSEFLATMSHEIRTPINAVLGYTELMRQGIPDPPTAQQREYLQRIERSSRLLISLIDDVLDFSRIESGRMRLEVGEGEAEEAVLAAVAALEPEATRKGIDLTVGCTDGRFHGDQQRVQQILLNLLSNAVKFTPSGGHVSVTCSPDAGPPPGEVPESGPWLCIDVEDTGIGIGEDQIERVFEPFEQGKVGFTREHGGAGLGLAISRRLAGLMSGHLTVQSRSGKGSRFSLWLRGAQAPSSRMAAFR